MGSSDIGGTIAVDPQTKPITVDANLYSHHVDLKDLGGFIGAKPGHEESKQAAASDRILPDKPINVPKLNAVNAHLVYKGDRIENKSTPLDNMFADIAVQDGAITINKLNFAVGDGTLGLSGALDPTTNGQFKTHFKVDVSRLSIQRLMKATDTFKGQGTLGGHVTLAATGNSIASLLGNGNGGVTLVVDHGGDVSALLPDLMGLKVGSAILSALGIPTRSDLKCFIADMPLRQGVLSTNSLLLMTNNTRTLGGGTVNLKSETLDYHVTTRSTSFNILSLPGRVNITGPLKSPTIMPVRRSSGAQRRRRGSRSPSRRPCCCRPSSSASAKAAHVKMPLPRPTRPRLRASSPAPRPAAARRACNPHLATKPSRKNRSAASKSTRSGSSA